MTNFLRCTVGKQSVPTYYSKYISEESKQLQDVYKDGIFEFETENKAAIEKKPVVWTDAEELLEAIVKERNLIGN